MLRIINSSLNTEVFPDNWITSKITIIEKIAKKKKKINAKNFVQNCVKKSWRKSLNSYVTRIMNKFACKKVVSTQE